MVSRRRDSSSVGKRGVRRLRAFRERMMPRAGGDDEKEVRERVRGGRGEGGRVRSVDGEEVELGVDGVDRIERTVVLRVRYPLVLSLLGSLGRESPLTLA